jgi:hypothetical protein
MEENKDNYQQREYKGDHGINRGMLNLRGERAIRRRRKLISSSSDKSPRRKKTTKNNYFVDDSLFNFFSILVAGVCHHQEMKRTALHLD